jgi:signal transduction histidine kinase/phage shock protein PspC (stress-responsive transcriptional regulator)
MSTRSPSADEPRRAYRSADSSYLGGVCGGLAEHLGVGVVPVRAFFVVTSLLGFFGVALYAALWIMLPLADEARHPVGEDSTPGLDAATRQGRRPSRSRSLRDAGPVVAVGALVVGLAAMVDVVFGGPGLLWPVLLAIGGVAVLWRQADEAQRERWIDSTGRLQLRQVVLGSGGVAAWTRLAVGSGLLLAALVVFAAQSGRVEVAREVVVAVGLGMAGLVVILGPWLVRLVSDLTDERAERVRSQERADVAAHLHDSVLQTLALIQKNAGDEHQVARLARSQERELRAWMFGTTTPDSTLSAALKAAAADVEDAHGVPVELVTVGDASMDDTLRALVDATREAVVNAAKHAGAPSVDVYAEVAPSGVAVFVRDRGRGFDPEVVAPDRLGVRRSIVDRMARHGGRAEVRSSPGQGTEVRLEVPGREQAGGS